MFRKSRNKKFSIDPEEAFTDIIRQSNESFGEYDGVVNLPVKFLSSSLIGVVALLFSSFFVYKAYSLQILDYDELSKKAFRNNFASHPIIAVRGSITDRYGEFLATTDKASSTDDAYTRKYTDRIGFGNILGFVTYPKKDKSGVFWQSSFEGVSGAEEYYNQLLAGSTGEKLYERKADGEIGEGFVYSEPINGKNLTLAIDAELQEFIYKELSVFLKKNNYAGGAGLIMNSRTGELISLISYPTYDSQLLMPEAGSTLSRAEYYKSLEDNPLKPFINRPISGIYAPGSIVKPLFAIAALDKGYINSNTSIFSSGKIEVPNPYTGKPTVFRDWKAHGWTNVVEAIAVSSDVFFYSAIGGYESIKGIGILALDEYAKAFDFDQKTGVDLPGEKTGLIPTPKWKEDTFGETWRLGDTYNSSIGQYGFTMTPIAAARVLSGIVNNGNLIQPTILKNQSNKDIVTQKVTMSLPDEWYKLSKEGMRMAVTNGTATNLNMPYVEVAAKTGTAEIGNSKSRVHTWITGYFPYQNPEFIFVFVAERGRRGDSPSPSIVMNKVFDWMRENRPEYLGISNAN